MNEFMTIMEGNTKPAKTLRKAKPEPEELTFLQKVREIRVSLLNGKDTLVVLERNRSFEELFRNFAPSMELYAKKALLKICTVDKVTASDLDMNIFEFDKEVTK